MADLNATVREWNAVREEMTKFNPELRTRPITKYLFMKTDEIMGLNDGFIVPDDYMVLLVTVPDESNASKVADALNNAYEAINKRRKDKIEPTRLNQLFNYLRSVIGKALPVIKNNLRDRRPVAPQSIPAVAASKPKIPTPSVVHDQGMIPRALKVGKAPDEPINPAKVIKGRATLRVRSNVISCALVVSLDGNTVVVEEYSGNTKPVKAGDGRVLVCQVPSNGIWKDSFEEGAL